MALFAQILGVNLPRCVAVPQRRGWTPVAKIHGGEKVPGAEVQPGLGNAGLLAFFHRSVHSHSALRRAAAPSLARSAGIGRQQDPRRPRMGQTGVCSAYPFGAIQKPLPGAHWAGRGLGWIREPGLPRSAACARVYTLSITAIKKVSGRLRDDARGPDEELCLRSRRLSSSKLLGFKVP